MTFTRLYELLFESPVDDFKYFQNDSENSNFSKTDKNYLNNPEKIRSLKNTFKNYNFNMYFCDSEISTRTGNIDNSLGSASIVDKNFLEKVPFKDESIKNKILSKLSSNNITCLFMGNLADDDRMPITPWQQAHRIGHVIITDNRNFGVAKENLYIIGQELIGSLIIKILYKKYPEFKDLELHAMYLNLLANTLEDYSKYTNWILYNLGTFKSARNKKVRNYFEFLCELIAQFLITGSIKLNSENFPEFKDEIIKIEKESNILMKNLFDSLKGKFLYIAFV